MRSILIATTAFLAGFWTASRVKQAPEEAPALVPPPEPAYNPAADYITYKWSCWLCSGDSQFACARPQGKITYMLPCSRCGMDNRVEVRAPRPVKPPEKNT